MKTMKQTISESEERRAKSDPGPEQEMPVQKPLVPNVDSVVLATYDGHMYPGKEQDVDEADGDTRISFMQRTNGRDDNELYKWQSKEDELCATLSDIVPTIEEPIPFGKTKHNSDYDLIT